MEITTLNKENMDALRKLSDINMKISESKATLQTMKGDVQVFLDDRDKKDKLRLEKLLVESKGIVDTIKSNHEQVTDYYNEVKTFSVFLGEFHEQLKKIASDFDADSKQFIEFTKREELKLSEIRKDIDTQLQFISSENKNIEQAKLEIEKEKRIIESRQAQIRSALQVISKRQ